MRYASTGYFSAYVAPNMDMSALLPPATILDLMVMQTSADKITLSFTDTGAALDSGTGQCLCRYVGLVVEVG